MTPEFCARLFRLGSDELGSLVDRDVAEVKVRVIPLQLQRLFARLLMLNVATVTTADLTSSFGWNNHEELDQHDIQELNRILFSAMEESLVGTTGQSLINDLYHGKMTNVIQCGLCGNVSERDEDFLDLCVSVSGSWQLEDSLARMFLEPEVLDTSNRYRCDACGQLTDAVKSTRLRHLPPVLTISLLRFNYDPAKMERYKDTGHFEFPRCLDMSCYCGAAPVTDSATAKDRVMNGFGCGDMAIPVCGDSLQPGIPLGHTYELFSVVVHRGGAHGGHYHALIQDLEHRGTWSEPEQVVTSTAEDKTACVPPKPLPTSTTSQVNVASPRSLITHILLESDSVAGMSVGDMSGRISCLAGESWRKRYKPRHGSFVKFLADNSDLFVYDCVREWISLVPGVGCSQLESGPAHKSQMNGTGRICPTSTPDPAPVVRRKKQSEPKPADVDISSPRSVITSILLEAGGGAAGLSVTDLCSKISDVTGDSWRKRYKAKHGSLVKFLSDNSDLFVHDVSGGWVTMLARPVGEEVTQNSTTNENNSADLSLHNIQHPDISSTVKSRAKRNRKKSKLKSSAHESTSITLQPEQQERTEMTMLKEAAPMPGHCWFDFNDTTIRPIPTEDIKKYFSGKECAYMLFYRSVPMAENRDVSNSKPMEIPDWLISEISEENLRLEQQRVDYEEFVSLIKVEIHFGRSYEYCEGVLRPCIGACYYMEHCVDVRQDVSVLLQAVAELAGELVEQCCAVHVAKSLPYGGLHLYEEVTANPASSLMSFGIDQSAKLFIWNGRDIGGVAIPVGCENEPISLRLELESSREFVTVTVAKNTTVFALKAMIVNRLQLSGVEKVDIYLAKAKGGNDETLASSLNKTVSEAGLCARDKIVVRHSGSLAGNGTRTQPQTCSAGSNVRTLPVQITVYCENHVADDVVMVDVEAEYAASVEELKVLIMTSADVPIELVNDVRLRIRLDDLGIRGVGPPLHEAVDLCGARLSDGVTVVLERGSAPCGSEVVLTVSVSASNELELTVDQDMAIHQLLHEVLLRAGVSTEDKEWHLCRSDWTGDSGAVLNEPNQTVGDAALNHGDHLFLRPGCLPPPGFVKIFIHLESSPARPCWWDPVRDMAAAILPSPVGSVVVSKQSTLAELKKRVMEMLRDYEIPSPPFLRLRVLTSSLRPASILRQHCQTLGKLKIGNGCALSVEFLPTEEDLGPAEIMLVVRRRLPGERNYSDWAQEVIWNTARGASVASLRSVVAETIGETESSIRIAKHIPDKFDWLIIPHCDDAFRPEKVAGGGVGGAKKKRKRKGQNGKPGGSVCDLLSLPFNLQDGDVIGVKVADEPGGADSDFGSVEDDTCKEHIRSQQKEMAAVNDAFTKYKTKQLTGTTVRAETPIRIYVDNFR